MVGANWMRGCIPLGVNPADDPDDETLLKMALEAAHGMAAERGLHAVDVKLTGKLPGMGGIASPRLAFFYAEAMEI